MLDTEDIVQQVLVKSIRQLETMDGRERGFLAYVRTAVVNEIRNAIRAAKCRPHGDEVDEALPSADRGPLEQLLGKEKVEAFETALLQLPTREQELIIARIDLRMTWGDIAIQFGMPTADAARHATKRAIDRLAHFIAQAERP
jgi:RNA polymerase sigma factor (sigma-70 family)